MYILSRVIGIVEFSIFYHSNTNLTNNTNDYYSSDSGNSQPILAKQPNAQTTKRPNNQTTKQPNNQTTKQPNNQTTKLPTIMKKYKKYLAKTVFF